MSLNRDSLCIMCSFTQMINSDFRLHPTSKSDQLVLCDKSDVLLMTTFFYLDSNYGYGMSTN